MFMYIYIYYIYIFIVGDKLSVQGIEILGETLSLGDVGLL